MAVLILENPNGVYFVTLLSKVVELRQKFPELRERLDRQFSVVRHTIANTFLRPVDFPRRQQWHEACKTVSHLQPAVVNNTHKKLMLALWGVLSEKVEDVAEWYKQIKALFNPDEAVAAVTDEAKQHFVRQYFPQDIIDENQWQAIYTALSLFVNEPNCDFAKTDKQFLVTAVQTACEARYDLEKLSDNLQINQLILLLRSLMRITTLQFKADALKKNPGDRVVMISASDEYFMDSGFAEKVHVDLEEDFDEAAILLRQYLAAGISPVDLQMALYQREQGKALLDHPVLQQAVDDYFSEPSMQLLANINARFPYDYGDDTWRTQLRDKVNAINNFRALKAFANTMHYLDGKQAWPIILDKRFVSWVDNGGAFIVHAFYVQDASGHYRLFVYDKDSQSYGEGRWQSGELSSAGAMKVSIRYHDDTSHSRIKQRTINFTIDCLARNIIRVGDFVRPDYVETNEVLIKGKDGVVAYTDGRSVHGENYGAVIVDYLAEKDKLTANTVEQCLQAKAFPFPRFAHQYLFNQLLQRLKSPQLKSHERVLLLQMLCTIDGLPDDDTADLAQLERSVYRHLPQQTLSYTGALTSLVLEAVRFLVMAAAGTLLGLMQAYGFNQADDFLPELTNARFAADLQQDTLPTLYFAKLMAFALLAFSSAAIAMRLISGAATVLSWCGVCQPRDQALAKAVNAANQLPNASFTARMAIALSTLSNDRLQPYANFYGAMSALPSQQTLLQQHLRGLLFNPFAVNRYVGAIERSVRRAVDYLVLPALVAYAVWALFRSFNDMQQLDRPEFKDISSSILLAMAKFGVLLHDVYQKQTMNSLINIALLLTAVVSFNPQWLFLLPDVLMTAWRGTTRVAANVQGAWQQLPSCSGLLSGCASFFVRDDQSGENAHLLPQHVNDGSNIQNSI